MGNGAGSCFATLPPRCSQWPGEYSGLTSAIHRNETLAAKAAKNNRRAAASPPPKNQLNERKRLAPLTHSTPFGLLSGLMADRGDANPTEEHEREPPQAGRPVLTQDIGYGRGKHTNQRRTALREHTPRHFQKIIIKKEK